MEQVSQLPELHREIAGWKGEINEVRESLNALKDRLGRMVSGIHRQADLAKVEHFQNQFICHKEVADELFHDMKHVFKHLPDDEAHGEEKIKAYDQLSGRMHSFRKLFTALQSGFEEFAGKMA